MGLLNEQMQTHTPLIRAVSSSKSNWQQTALQLHIFFELL